MTDYLAPLFGLSIALLLLSVVILPAVVAALPADYFSYTAKRKPASDRLSPRIILMLPFFVLKNVFGAALLLAGVAMLVLPGQGLVTIIAGLGLMNFPGKYKLERKLIRIPAVLRSANWLRRKWGKVDFIFEGKPDRPDASELISNQN